MKTQNYWFHENFCPMPTREKMLENIRGCVNHPELVSDDLVMETRPVNVLEIGDKILIHHATGGCQNDDGITTGCKWIWIEATVEKILSSMCVWVRFNRAVEGGKYLGINYGPHDGCSVGSFFEPTDRSIKTFITQEA